VKAAVFYETGGPEVFRYEEVPDPALRPGGLLVEVGAVGVQGGDLLHRQGGVLATQPHVVGYQAAGIVREVGEGVEGFAVGQPVVATMGYGSHAELVSVPARAAWSVPDGLTVEQAAGVPIEYGTAHDCLFEFGRLQAGETVLIQAGASGVGVAAIQLAKQAGATVLATASSEERLNRLWPLGLDTGIDYTADDWVDRVRNATQGRGVDLVVDSVGGPILQGSLQCLAYRGRCITVGQAGREGKLLDVSSLGAGNQTLTGVFLGAEIATPRAQGIIGDLVNDVASGKLEVLIDRTFPLSDAAAAHAFIESRQAVGRVVLIP
jgi:NADPH2:quinone reductase